MSVTKISPLLWAVCLAVLLLNSCIVSSLPSRAADPYYYGNAAAGLKSRAETITAMEKTLTRLSSPGKWKVALTEEGAAIQVKEDVYAIGWCDMDPTIPILAVDLLMKDEYIVKLAQGEDPPFFQFNREEDARAIHSQVLKMMYLSGCETALPPQHTVSVSSTPPGALVYLDDRQKGVTPMDFRSAEVWNRMLRLELKGFLPLEQAIDITANGSYHFSLEKLEVELTDDGGHAAPPALPPAMKKNRISGKNSGHKRMGSTVQKKKEFLKTLYLKNAITSEQFERAIRTISTGKPDRLVEDLVSGRLSPETFKEVY